LSEIVVCSNRGPFIHERKKDGSFKVRRGGGGLVVSLEPVMERLGGSWIASTLVDGDREFAREFPRGREEEGFHLRLLDIPEDLHRLHYEHVSNEVLWFLFHYLFDPPSTPAFDEVFSHAWDGYRRVNEIYADAVIDMPGDAVLFEDYHLMLAASIVRQRSRKRRPLLYFHHTPWCAPTYFSLLPDAVGLEILNGMLAHDVVGFHARKWADAFAACCERFVPGATRDGDDIVHKRRRTRILVAPVPVDTDRLRAEADDERVVEWMSKHDEMRAGRHLMLRVDRIDLSKNPLRGFLAFEKLLEATPKLCNDVLFLALLYPSRLSVERYQRYYTECLGVVGRINERFERKVKSGAGPIHLVFEDDYPRSLAAMRLADTLVVNPIFDGLNLVAKECPTINDRDGSVILSRNAGVFEEIGSGTIAINPFDINATADAMRLAIEMPIADRKRNARKLRTLATRSTPADWLRLRLAAAGL
jgi:trehalose 6-phosphate synthase